MGWPAVGCGATLAVVGELLDEQAETSRAAVAITAENLCHRISVILRSLWTSLLSSRLVTELIEIHCDEQDCTYSDLLPERLYGQNDETVLEDKWD